MIVDPISGADRDDLIHVGRPTLGELFSTLREESVKPAGHCLNEHVQRLIVGIAKRVNTAPRHEHRRLGLSDDEVRQWSQVAGMTPQTPLSFISEGKDGLTVNIWTVDKLSANGERAA